MIADDESNSIIIQDVPEKMDQLLDYIKTIDAPQIKFINCSISRRPLVAKLQEMVSPKIGSVNLTFF